MKQLLILSGKGGTGKTTVAGAFIKLAAAKAYADCDVDAPNLHLIATQRKEPKRSDYYGMPKAEIDNKLCILCDKCREHCKFDAIVFDKSYSVDNYACEGCGVCAFVCPTDAITMIPAVSGETLIYLDGKQVFSTAKLKMGSGNSGLLVSKVKKQLKENVNKDAEIAIIDGSPGIGCPVIASISGVDTVLIVAEPTLSGISDMERIIKTAKSFENDILVCINKFDVNLENTEKIIDYCKDNDIEVVGKIPFDINVVNATNEGKTIVDIDCMAKDALTLIFNKIIGRLQNEGEINDN